MDDSLITQLQLSASVDRVTLLNGRLSFFPELHLEQKKRQQAN